MAHWIDRAVLWAFAAASAFLFTLSLTSGRIFFSALTAFGLTCLLRSLIRRLPEKRWTSRAERSRYIRTLMLRWAIEPQEQSKDALNRLLPSLLTAQEWRRAQLIQRLPESTLCADQFLSLRREFPADEEVILLCTCPASDDARALISSLPPCRLIDGQQLARALAKVIRTVPAEEAKQERRRPLSGRIAPFIRTVRPLRTGFYALLFVLLYLITRRLPYLLAAALFAVLLAVRASLEISVRRGS